ncbi:MAG: hypothetical protein J6R04_02620 [Clostridia bacterium]|nr:hypothetical protein [Clostridia bacterium]
MKKGCISVNKLKELTQEYISLGQTEEGHSTEWAYVMLEPTLHSSKEVTLAFFKQMDKIEFDALVEFFEDAVTKFQSKEMVETIESLYARFYGQDVQSEIYLQSIVGLRACIKDI